MTLESMAVLTVHSRNATGRLGVIVAKIPNPSVNLLKRRERWQDAHKGCERILFYPRWLQNGATVLKDKLNAITLFEAKPMPNFDRNGNLSLAADCAGRRHIYSSIKK
jgi:hypothetical protein